jgi:putative NADPH-quinone reductase
MTKRILIIQAHPDTSRLHLAHSLAAAYVKGAEGAGHVVRQVVLATLDFPLLRSQQEWEEGSVPASLKSAPAYRSWLCAVGAAASPQERAGRDAHPQSTSTTLRCRPT